VKLLKINSEMLPLIRSCRDISQAEFSFYMRVPQARLSDLETGKIPITKHYENKIWNALESLHISNEELQHIYELVQLKNKK
jgi:transcriptional regulator with XRE-family HTH domain